METLYKYKTEVWFGLTLASVASLGGAFWSGAAGSMLFVPLGIGCIALLGVRDVLSRSARLKEASAEMAEAAVQLGFEFQEKASFNVLGWPDCFMLTKLSSDLQNSLDAGTLPRGFASLFIPKSRNLMTRMSDTAQLALFDYEYTDNDVTYPQACVAIASPKLAHPWFALFPATIYHSVVDRFRGTPAVLESHRLVCSGETQPPGAREIAQALPEDLSLEVGDGFMLLYRSNRQPLRPTELESRITEALQVYAAVCDQLELQYSSSR